MTNSSRAPLNREIDPFMDVSLVDIDNHGLINRGKEKS